MKTTITLAIFLLSLNSFGWGAPDILPAADRAKTYEFQTKLDQKKSFQKISIWAAKTFANSNESIKLKDADAGVLIAKGNVSCDALKLGNGYAKDQNVYFTLEIAVENKKAAIKITDLVGKSSGAFDDDARPSKKEEMAAAVKDCLDPFVEAIKAELK